MRGNNKKNREGKRCIWKTQNHPATQKISLKTKLNVYKATVIAITTYSSETWQLTKKDTQKLDAYEYWEQHIEIGRQMKKAEKLLDKLPSHK